MTGVAISSALATMMFYLELGSPITPASSITILNHRARQAGSPSINARKNLSQGQKLTPFMKKADGEGKQTKRK